MKTPPVNAAARAAITKAGNSSARRALVEAAWAYQYTAKVSGLIARRQTDVPKAALDIAWKAQVRLCARFRRLAARGREPQQDRGGDRPRAGRLRVGHRATGQAGLTDASSTNQKGGSAPQTIDRFSSIGEVTRSRLENPRADYWIAIAATPQTLERGSSVTNNSLAANQRPHISLIDRRHR